MRLYYRHGWLLYAHPDMSGGTVLTGNVLSFELAAEHAYRATLLRLTAELHADGALRAGQQADRPVEQLMWDALQSWPEPGRKDGRRWPPEMLALLGLARNHPAEYERLRDGEAVLRALGG